MKYILGVLLFIMLIGCNNQQPTLPEVSETFRSGGFVMRGIEGKIGFIDVPFQANKGNKYMWHLWGSKEELDGEFKIVGYSLENQTEIEMFQIDSLSGPHNGADASTVSIMELPSKGLWELRAYIDNKLFETIVIEVK